MSKKLFYLNLGLAFISGMLVIGYLYLLPKLSSDYIFEDSSRKIKYRFSYEQSRSITAMDTGFEIIFNDGFVLNVPISGAGNFEDDQIPSYLSDNELIKNDKGWNVKASEKCQYFGIVLNSENNTPTGLTNQNNNIFTEFHSCAS